MQVSNTAALIGGAVFLAAFAAFVIPRELRRGDRGRAWGAAPGLLGVYLSFCAAIEHADWLYVPGVLLVGAAYAVQFVYPRRTRGRSAELGTGPDPGGNGS